MSGWNYVVLIISYLPYMLCLHWSKGWWIDYRSKQMASYNMVGVTFITVHMPPYYWTVIWFSCTLFSTNSLSPSPTHLHNKTCDREREILRLFTLEMVVDVAVVYFLWFYWLLLQVGEATNSLSPSPAQKLFASNIFVITIHVMDES